MAKRARKASTKETTTPVEPIGPTAEEVQEQEAKKQEAIQKAKESRGEPQAPQVETAKEKTVPASGNQIATHLQLTRQLESIKKQMDMLFLPSSPFPPGVPVSYKLENGQLVFTRED